MHEKASLTAKQQQAILLLIEGRTGLAAAETCGINEATLYRWKQLPQWKAGYRDAEREVTGQTLSRIVRYGNAAVDCLARNMANDSGASAAIRGVQVRAALGIIDAIVQLHLKAPLEDEIAELREAVRQAQERA